MKSLKIIKLFLYPIVIGLYWYLNLPTLVLSDNSTYANLMILFIILAFIEVLFILLENIINKSSNFVHFTDLDNLSELLNYNKLVTSFLTLFIISLLATVSIAIYDSPAFHSSSIKNLIKQEKKKSFKDLSETNFNTIPVMSRDTAKKLTERYLGSIKKASEFKVSDDYTQINYKGRPVRVSPLMYTSVFSWFNNHKEGITQYIMVDMISQDVKIVNLKNHIHYSKTEYFNHDINRHLKLKYPLLKFNDPSFELDDEGNAYYVATTYKNKIFGSYLMPNGVILVNASTGEMTRYKDLNDVPNWVDRIYPEYYMQNYINLQNSLVHGFINSLTSKRDVTKLSPGYNYLTINNDMYLYSGITTLSSPDSNLGFVLINLRNGSVTQYKLASATETSAQSSAESEISEKHYSASFPSLIKINNKAGYLLSLTDNDVIKKYAIVDAVSYQKVYVADSIQGAVDLFINANTVNKSNKELSMTISDIKTVTIKGYTYYMFKNTTDGEIYKASIELNDKLAYIQDNQQITGKLKSNSNEFNSLKLK